MPCRGLEGTRSQIPFVLDRPRNAPLRAFVRGIQLPVSTSLIASVDSEVRAQSCATREDVATLVLLIACMTPDPHEFHLMYLAISQQSFPKIWINGPLLFVAPPTFGSPSGGPSSLYGVHQVLGIAIDCHTAGLLERFETCDRCQDLHSIVSGSPESARQLFSMLSVLEHDAVTARSWIRNATSVGINDYVLQIFHPCAFKSRD